MQRSWAGVPGASLLNINMRNVKQLLVFVGLVLAVACGGGKSPHPPDATVTTAPRTIVDSVFPVAEEIRRFKAAHGGSTAAELQGGAQSRDELVRDFVRALEQHDSASLRAMVLTAGEFIDLYYPTSMYAQPPYRQSPELRWFLMQENSNKGIGRLLQRYGGRPTGFQGYDCAATVQIEGQNHIHDRCTVAWSQRPTTLRAFSTIIERDGRFKFMSYANDL